MNLDTEYYFVLVDYAEAYVDLVNKKLVFTLSFETQYSDERYLSYNYRSEVTFTEIGSTVVDYPIEIAKEAVNKKLDEAINERVEINYATDDSLTEFYTMIDVHRNNINSQTTFSQFGIVINQYLIDINNYDFTVDDLKQLKYNTKLKMANDLNHLKNTATLDSIGLMEDVYNSYLLLIDASNTTEDITLNYNNYYTDLNNAYILEESLIIDDLKDEKIYKLNNLVEKNNMYLLNIEDGINYTNVVEDYIVQINTATTVAEVNSLYQEAYNQLVALDYPYHDILYRNYKIDVIYSLKNMILDIESRFGSLSSNVHQYFDNYKVLIENSRSVIEIDALYQENLRTLNNVLISEVKTKALNIIEERYIEYSTFIFDEESFNTLYISYIDQINDCTNYFTIIELVSNFESVYLSYEYDALNYYKYTYKINIYSSFLTYILDATDDSLSALEFFYNDAIQTIDASLTLDQLNINYENGLLALYDAYTLDPAKKDLINYKNSFTNKMQEYIDYTSSYLVYYNELMILNDVYNDYYERIMAAPSTIEVDLIYSEWYNQLLSGISIDVQKQLTTHEQYLSTIQNKYNYMIASFTTLPDDFTNVYNDYYTNLNLSNNLILDLDIYTSVSNYLNSLELTLVKNQSLEEIEENYQYYSTIIIDYDIPILEDIYQSTLESINNCINVDDIIGFTDTFLFDCNYLEIDQFKYDRYLTVEDFKDDFAVFKISATLESIEAMQLVLDSNIPIIESSLSYSELSNNYINAYNQLEAAYIPLVE